MVEQERIAQGGGLGAGPWLLSTLLGIERHPCLLNFTQDEAEAATAIVVLTMEEDFHRQVDCLLSRKIKPISTTTRESVRAATSKGTKRKKTQVSKLYKPACFLYLERKQVSQYFPIKSVNTLCKGLVTFVASLSLEKLENC